MTKEEAIKILPDMKGEGSEWDEAIDVAMDALKTQLPSAQPKQNREFMKLTFRNLDGRPYFSIVYLEFDDNGIGQDVEGYSSYSLDVISEYLKKYFMPSAQPNLKQTHNELATDVISRQDAIDAVEESRRLNHHQDGKEACAHEYEHRHFLKILRDLPSAQQEPEELDFVQPHKKIGVQLEIAQPEQKTGKWIWKLDERDPDRSMMLVCSICDSRRDEVGTYNFCHICGTKMINPRGEQDETN